MELPSSYYGRSRKESQVWQLFRPNSPAFGKIGDGERRWLPCQRICWFTQMPDMPTDSQLNDLLTFLKFPSVSTQSEHASDMRACAEWLCRRLAQAGLTARVEETGGHPSVLASTSRVPSKKNVLIYGHYDVQPPDPLQEWTTPPFDPAIRDGRVFARGSTDNKGQILAHILGVEETLARGGESPVNVTFLIEGEEEIGSPNLAPLIRRLAGELACDVVVISDTGMVAHGYPTLTFSLRGVAGLEFVVRGPSHDLHSGVFGGAVMNPAAAVAKLVASLHDENGHVAIEGFYDDVRPMFDWEREASDALPVGDEDIRKLAGVPALFGEPGYSAMDRIGARPTAEVNGIGGGYQGEGTKTVLPSEAMAKLTFRLVPHQKAKHILDLAEHHLRLHCPPGVNLAITRGHCGPPYYTDPNSELGHAAGRALERVFGRPPALLREGGSIPILGDFQEILGAECLLLALASPDCRTHSPNENFPLENFAAGIRLNRAVLEELST
jgi:acetylornithine deacetylase/succinyl-diaminopimelate desuccinylase-like protein